MSEKYDRPSKTDLQNILSEILAYRETRKGHHLGNAIEMLRERMRADETSPVRTACDDCKADRDRLRAALRAIATGEHSKRGCINIAERELGSPEEPTRRIPPREFDVETHTGLYTEPEKASEQPRTPVYPDDWKKPNKVGCKNFQLRGGEYCGNCGFHASEHDNI